MDFVHHAHSTATDLVVDFIVVAEAGKGIVRTERASKELLVLKELPEIFLELRKPSQDFLLARLVSGLEALEINGDDFGYLFFATGGFIVFEHLGRPSLVDAMIREPWPTEDDMLIAAAAPATTAAASAPGATVPAASTVSTPTAIGAARGYKG
jgi:hypothetical protein